MTIQTIETSSFEKTLETQKPILVDFWAPWCGYCRRLSPVIDQFAKDYDGKIVIGKVNIDEQPELASRFEVETIPTLILFRNGVPASTIVAPESRAQVAAWLKQNDVQAAE